MRVQLIFVCFIFLLAIGGTAEACSCMGVGPACTEASDESNSAIFVGEVLLRGFPSFGLIHDDAGDHNVYFTVLESFKGTSSRWVSVRTNIADSACGFPFERGKRYLVYASKHAGALRTSICHRTMPLARADADLAYLRAMQNLPDVSEVYGTYKKYTFDPQFKPSFQPSIMDHYRPPEETYRALAPMSGETVTLVSDRGEKRTVMVSKDGHFSFKSLPPGKYSIAASSPPKMSKARGYVAGRGSSAGSFDVAAKGCAEVTFRTEPDGHIKGRVVDAHGNPITTAWIKLYREDVSRDDPGSGFKFYDLRSDGSFDAGPIPPGRYTLEAYVWSIPGRDYSLPFDDSKLEAATRRYFPGTPDREKAKPIAVGFGQHITGIVITLPFKPEEWKQVRR